MVGIKTAMGGGGTEPLQLWSARVSWGGLTFWGLIRLGPQLCFDHHFACMVVWLFRVTFVCMMLRLCISGVLGFLGGGVTFVFLVGWFYFRATWIYAGQFAFRVTLRSKITAVKAKVTLNRNIYYQTINTHSLCVHCSAASVLMEDPSMLIEGVKKLLMVALVDITLKGSGICPLPIYTVKCVSTISSQKFEHCAWQLLLRNIYRMINSFTF